jgi:hypothetical protein
MFGRAPNEELKELSDLPRSSVGAPCPLILATEHNVHVTYFLQSVPESWDGTTVRVVEPASTGEPSIVVTFRRVTAHYFGMPNDEAIAFHQDSERLGLDRKQWLRGGRLAAIIRLRQFALLAPHVAVDDVFFDRLSILVERDALRIQGS